MAKADDFLSRYMGYTRLFFAARPENETPSLYLELKSKLDKLGFLVLTVFVESGQSESFYNDRAKEIFAHIQ